MIGFYFESASAQQDAEAALVSFGLNASAVQPVFGARPEPGGPPKILFANRAMLALFNAADLEALKRRLFSAQDHGAKRLLNLAQKPLAIASPRLERLRFYFGATTHIFTFSCGWVSGSKAPLFAAAVLDAPAYLSNAATDSVLEGAERPAGALRETLSQTTAMPREAKAMRFLWRTDAEDRFMEITPPLAEIVGKASANLIGRSLRQISDMLRLDPDHALAKAFAARETWSGVEVRWPIAGTSTNVPVVLGALPSFDRDKRFEGYHGFGVIYIHRIAPASVPVSDGLEEAARSEADINKDGLAPPSLYQGENVVAFRPLGTPLGLTSKPGVPESAADMAPTADVETPELTASEIVAAGDLSSAEQNAFQEIGRALTGASADEEAADSHEE